MIRIGIIVAGSAYSMEGFKPGLRDLGWLEGENISFELRAAEGELHRSPEFANDMVNADVDAIAVIGAVTVRVVRQATSNIPIVDFWRSSGEDDSLFSEDRLDEECRPREPLTECAMTNRNLQRLCNRLVTDVTTQATALAWGSRARTLNFGLAGTRQPSDSRGLGGSAGPCGHHAVSSLFAKSSHRPSTPRSHELAAPCSWRRRSAFWLEVERLDYVA